MKITSKITGCVHFNVNQSRLDFIADKARLDKINKYKQKYKRIAKIVTKRKAKLAADAVRQRENGMEV